MHRSLRRALLGLLVPAVLACGCKDKPDPGDDDDAPPEDVSIAIESPEEGTIGKWAQVTVEGTFTGEEPTVTVSGTEATLDGDSFSAEVPVVEGLPYTPLLAEAATDYDWARDRRTFLYGDAVASDAPVDRGMALRITDRGLAGLGTFLLSAFEPEAVEQMIMDTNPLYEGDLVVAEIVITADGASVGGLEAELDATATGILLTGSLTDVTLDVTVDAGWAGDYPGTIHVESVDMTALMVLGAAGGVLTVTVQDVVIDLVNLTMDFEDLWDWLDTGLAWIVPLFIEGMIEDMITEDLPGAVEEALGALDEGFALGPVTIGLAFDDVQHDDAGVNVVLDLSVDTGGAAGLPPQRVATEGELPVLSGSTTPGGQPYGAQIVLDDDALNAIGIGLLASGELEQSMEGGLPTDPPIPLTADMLIGIFPSLEGEVDSTALMSLATVPTVPLVGTPAEGPESAVDLHLPGFMVDIGGDLSGSGSPEPIYSVVVDGVIRIGVDTEEQQLTVYGDDMVATLLSCEIECDPTEGEGLAALLQLAIGMFVGDLTTGLTQLIEGVEMIPLEGGTVGSEEDHAAIWADLEEVPVE